MNTESFTGFAMRSIQVLDTAPHRPSRANSDPKSPWLMIEPTTGNFEVSIAKTLN